MNNLNKQFNHSIIVDFPIDYNLYPLSKNVDIIKIVLEKDEYIIIPPFWFHWVYTDPETIAISYEIFSLSGEDKFLYNSFYNNIPIKCNGNKTNIIYDDFINSSLNNNFLAVLSKTSDCSPVIKDNNIKMSTNDTLLNIIKYVNNKNMYAYIGNEPIKNIKSIEEYIDITKLINLDDTLTIKYNVKLWLNLKKSINSGLHYDENAKFLYVLTGKKTFYLIHPKEKNNLYLQLLPILPSFVI